MKRARVLLLGAIAMALPADAGAVRLPSRPELDVTISAPKSARYVPGAAGPEAEEVRVRVTNKGAAEVPVAWPRVSFTATRNGVPFPCKHHDGGGMSDPEPKALPPGATFTFERDVDCALTALGKYEIGVRLGFARADYDHGEPVGSFVLEVLGSGPSAPRPHPARPGLHVALTGDTAAAALTPEQWLRGDYKVLVVIVDTEHAPVTVGPMRATLHVTSKKASPTCASERMTIPLPGTTTFEPGRARTFELPVRCPLTPGREYDVGVRLALEPGAPEPEVGSLHVKVQSDEDVPLEQNRPPSR
jgi:hypothetical protein